MRLIYLSLCLLFAHCLHANDQVFKGQVISVQKYAMANKPVSYLQFILNTPQGNYTVEMGPEGYLRSQGISLVSWQEIELTGSLCSAGAKTILVAKSIRQGNRTIQLSN